MNMILKIASLMAGASLMTSLAAAAPDPTSDLRIDPQIRSFLAEINKDSAPFWELPQPKPQEILTSLQSQTSVDMSGVSVTETTITEDGRTVKLYIMKPTQVGEKPGVLLFIHGGVWIVGNCRWRSHRRSGKFCRRQHDCRAEPDGERPQRTQDQLSSPADSDH